MSRCLINLMVLLPLMSRHQHHWQCLSVNFQCLSTLNSTLKNYSLRKFNGAINRFFWSPQNNKYLDWAKLSSSSLLQSLSWLRAMKVSSLIDAGASLQRSLRKFLFFIQCTAAPPVHEDHSSWIQLHYIPTKTEQKSSFTGYTKNYLRPCIKPVVIERL